MKTNHKLQLLAAATMAMLAINPAARAQTPAPLSDEMLLHALATGQVGLSNDNFTLVNGGTPGGSQLGVGGGNDDRYYPDNDADAYAGAWLDDPNYLVLKQKDFDGMGDPCDLQQPANNYGGAAYLQSQPAASYGGGIYNTTADSQRIILWYNDFYSNTGGNVTAASSPSSIEVYPGLYLQSQSTTSYGGALYYGGAIYNATASAPPVNSWYNDFYGNVSAPNPNSGFTDSDGSVADLHATTTSTYGGGLYLQSQPTASYGGALYHSTGSSLVGEELPGEALWGEDFPGDALTDAQLDALILGALAGICDDSDNCPVAPMPR